MISNKAIRPEILAPCGSYDILKTAINAGADACYIGGSRFGARAFAENLGANSIFEAVDYAHIHGASLYLTVNTLFKEAEIKEAYDYLLPYYEAGVDAVIVQDLGTFSIIRRLFPDLKIHCSTQMNINSVYAAGLMKELGAVRVVTAREMPLSEIKAIKSAVDIEIETFVHGAMCYSYSGQCLMSSMAGGRSGNRGRCAQPCRKCYNGSYVLSMKDMCALELLPQIIEAGTDSLKIEGRMKNEYYVASCVDAYRELTDDYINGTFDISKAIRYKERLANIYNRGGFTEGYFFMHNGPDMISIDRPNNSGVIVGAVTGFNQGKIDISLSKPLYKQDVLEIALKDNSIIEITSPVEANAGEKVTLNCPKTRLVRKNASVRRTRCNRIINEIEDKLINRECKKNHLDVVIDAHVGSSLSLYAEITGTDINISIASGTLIQESQNRPVTRENILEKLNQLSDTNYIINSATINLDKNAFLPMGEIKKLRRAMAVELDKKLSSGFRRRAAVEIPNRDCNESPVPVSDSISAPRLRVMVSTTEQLKEVLQHKDMLEVIYISRYLYDEAVKSGIINCISGVKLYIILPYIITSEFDITKYLEGIDYDGIYVRNIDGYAALKSIEAIICDREIVLGNSLYSYNSEAYNFLKTNMRDKITIEAPSELRISEIKDINMDFMELPIYHHQRVMLSNQCVEKTLHGCKMAHTTNKITDDRGNSFYAACVCEECCNVIYNGVAYNLIDRLNSSDIMSLKPYSYKIEFTIESADTIHQIMNGLRSVTAYGKEQVNTAKYTTGHLYRGVE